jgi:hypothetical protein
LTRLAIRQCVGLKDLDSGIKAKSKTHVFSLSNGQLPTSMHTSFELLLKDTGMPVD